MLLNVHAAVTWYLVGLIWLVQVVQYPMFAYLDRRQFAEAHAFHSSAIGLVVAPPMLLELGLAAWIAWQGGRGTAGWTAFALVLIIWASTFFVIVPIHGQLGSNGFDAALHAKLVAWNWVRTVAWSLRGLLAFHWIQQA
jgi:hypothetical protein